MYVDWGIDEMLCITKKKMIVPSVRKLYSVEAVQRGNCCELCTFLCIRHVPGPSKYFIVFNHQNNNEKYIDYSSFFIFYTWDNEDFENLNDFTNITK